MKNDVPAVRRWRYAAAAADEESRTADLRITADTAAADATLLLAAGEVRLAGGAATVMLRAILLRAAAPASDEGVAAEVDIDDKRRSAQELERIGAPLAAAMVRAAVTAEATALAGRSESTTEEQRP